MCLSVSPGSERQIARKRTYINNLLIILMIKVYKKQLIPGNSRIDTFNLISY